MPSFIGTGVMSGVSKDNATTMNGDLSGGSTANFGQLEIDGPTHFGNINNYTYKEEDGRRTKCLQALALSLGSGKDVSEVRLSLEARKGRKTKNTFRWLIDGDQLRE